MGKDNKDMGLIKGDDGERSKLFKGMQLLQEGYAAIEKEDGFETPEEFQARKRKQLDEGIKNGTITGGLSLLTHGFNSVDHDNIAAKKQAKRDASNKRIQDEIAATKARKWLGDNGRE